MKNVAATFRLRNSNINSTLQNFLLQFIVHKIITIRYSLSAFRNSPFAIHLLNLYLSDKWKARDGKREVGSKEREVGSGKRICRSGFLTASKSYNNYVAVAFMRHKNLQGGNLR